MIPEVAIHNIMQRALDAVRLDYASYSGTPSDTLLFQLLGSISDSDLLPDGTTSKYNWFDQGVEIFITRDENHPKYLDTRLFFDRERAPIPTVHVMLTGESKGQDGLGVDMGFNPPQTFGPPATPTGQRPVYNRQFSTDIHIVCTSDNAFETVIIYHVFKSMLISIIDHIQLYGFINPQLSGREITISQELVPSGIFTKAINFTAGYELSVPVATAKAIANQVFFTTIPVTT